MNIIFTGPPGAGKGTQAQYFAAKYGFNHVSTGQILRDEVQRNTPLGNQIKDKMFHGAFIEDSIILDLVSNVINQNKKNIFDGFPRTLIQAENFDKLLKKHSSKVDIVIDFNISLDVLIERTVGRFSCKKCGAVYHMTLNPLPASEACLYCYGKEFVKRADDTAEILKVRYEEYLEKTCLISDFYSKKGIVKQVDSSQLLSKVQSDVEVILNQIGIKA